MADFDNDGWQDLFMAAGHFFPEVDRLKIVQKFRNPGLLYWNLGNGRFEDVRTGPDRVLPNRTRAGAPPPATLTTMDASTSW